jgi:hypothetical protein
MYLWQLASTMGKVDAVATHLWMCLTAVIAPSLKSFGGPAAAKADATQRRALVVATDLPSACKHSISMFETSAVVRVVVSVNKRVTHTIYTHPNSPGQQPWSCQ